MSLSAAAEKEAIIELKRELVAWGVDSNEAIHRRFREGVIATVRGCFTSINASYHHKPPKIVNPEVLPNNDTAKAIRRVLQSTVGDLDIKFCRDIVDTCGTKRPPYLVYPRKDDPRELTSPKKKFEYKKFSKQQLDPFHRFSVIQYPSKLEYFYDCWVVADEDARLGGLVFEALVSSHAIHSEPCFHCKCRKSLRWNGGPLTPWTDLVYLHCDSAFEIKSKEGMEAIERGHT